MKILPYMIAIVALAVAALGEETAQPEAAADGFERYRVILDRAPFGAAPPPGSLASNVITEEAVTFAKSLRLCTIIQKETGIRIGFVDTGSNRSYLMGVGDPPEDEIEVIEASWEKEEAILKKGSVMALLKLKSGEAKALPAGGVAALANAVQAPGAPPSRPYMERRQQRTVSVPPPMPAPQLSGTELQKHLQDYQMEVIRQGLPPLPMQLSREQDDQLVREGVLPPQ